MKLPAVTIVDMQDERRHRRGIHLMSRRLEQELERVLKDDQGQAMLLLNRRGYANYIACPDHRCGWMMRCEHCDATVVYHKNASLPTGGYVRCHHCDAEQLPLLPPAPTPGTRSPSSAWARRRSKKLSRNSQASVSHAWTRTRCTHVITNRRSTPSVPVVSTCY
ncbi:MAG: hypothetical protein R3C45_00720 [Phycisphaerales bacterium]